MAMGVDQVVVAECTIELPSTDKLAKVKSRAGELEEAIVKAEIEGVRVIPTIFMAASRAVLKTLDSSVFDIPIMAEEDIGELLTNANFGWSRQDLLSLIESKKLPSKDTRFAG